MSVKIDYPQSASENQRTVTCKVVQDTLLNIVDKRYEDGFVPV